MTCVGIVWLSSLTMAIAVPTDDIIDLPPKRSPSARPPSSREIMINGIPMDRCYLLCCPAQNKDQFAQWLNNREIDVSALTAEEATLHYHTYLRDQHTTSLQDILREIGGDPNTYEQEIQKVLPVFKDMYEGIIRPILNLR